MVVTHPPAYGSALKLDQVSDYLGKVNVIIADRGLRFSCTKFIAFIFLPERQLLLFNPETKRYIKGTHKDFMRLVRTREVDPASLSYRRTKEEKIGGIPAIKYNVMRRYGDGHVSLFREIWTTRSLKMSAAAQAMLEDTMSIPRGLGVPVKIVNKIPHELQTLNTIKAMRCRVDKSTFVSPQGYQLVKSEVDLFVGAKDSKEIEDMLKDMTVD
ncbi:MAG TPA: hypothetical protein V6D17_18425 [Candidatus Obscuribacterales bacterium]